MELAARIGDGFVAVRPDAEAVGRYRDKAGGGRTIGAMKVCWDNDEGRALKLAHKLWPTDCRPGS